MRYNYPMVHTIEKSAILNCYILFLIVCTKADKIKLRKQGFAFDFEEDFGINMYKTKKELLLALDFLSSQKLLYAEDLRPWKTGNYEINACESDGVLGFLKQNKMLKEN